MAYGRDILRRAGQSFLDFDERYADRAARDLGGFENSPLKAMFGGVPLKGPYANDGETWGEKLIGGAAIAAPMAVNVGYRYGLPAAGVTLAGQGLYDLTTALNQQTESTIMP